MPATKIKAFLNEYPFILDLLDNNVIQQVFVSRINPELINRTLHGEVVDDGIFESRLVNETQEWVFLLDEGNKIVLGTKKLHTKPFLWFKPKAYMKIVKGVVCFGETIEEKLVELGNAAQDVHTIVSYSERTKAVILYKPQRGSTVLEWINQQIAFETDSLRAEMESVQA